MKTRKFFSKRRFMALATGSVTLALLFGNSCTSNAALTTFYTGVGVGAIDTAADAAANIGSDFDAIVVKPTAGFFSNLWATFVSLHIPADPVFQNSLLVK